MCYIAPPPPYVPYLQMSKKHSELIWFALQCDKAKPCTVLCDHDHTPVSQGCMRVQYALLMALCPTNALSNERFCSDHIFFWLRPELIRNPVRLFS